ncbi:winged helix DNA-binding domain-containing protein [Kibdelosporangium philippinense]|uniref:Winged helix DNA-binding domain-containing protein n=1 Tax=Kibdelosporangium philippinense TaxID=211113 RepID=A0ABS8Z6Q4_9PSEU|nr:winged helix DNA-binding domain-containing protein [Kibdelosporangium philippinense]MCE7002321.1 winged helix DNA-binding domain-containing protein [Kibdelosporangium philippinense]
MSAADYPSFAVAWRQQALNDMRGKYRKVSVDEDKILKGLIPFVSKPRTTDEIREHVADLCGGVLDSGDLLHYARALLPMTHVFPSGAFRQHGKFSLVGLKGDLPVEPAATALLVRRYLAAFGPATREDIAHFTYLKYRQLDPALAELDVIRLSDKEDRDLIDLPRAPRPAEDVDIPVRFLAKWDAAVISHKDRTRILPAAYHTRVVRKINGDVLSTYLIDGKVAGTWSCVRKGATATIVLEPFEPVPSSVHSELEAESLAVARFLEPDAETLVSTFT